MDIKPIAAVGFPDTIRQDSKDNPKKTVTQSGTSTRLDKVTNCKNGKGKPKKLVTQSETSTRFTRSDKVANCQNGKGKPKKPVSKSDTETIPYTLLVPSTIFTRSDKKSEEILEMISGMGATVLYLTPRERTPTDEVELKRQKFERELDKELCIIRGDIISSGSDLRGETSNDQLEDMANDLKKSYKALSASSEIPIESRNMLNRKVELTYDYFKLICSYKYYNAENYKEIFVRNESEEAINKIIVFCHHSNESPDIKSNRMLFAIEYMINVITALTVKGNKRESIEIINQKLLEEKDVLQKTLSILEEKYKVEFDKNPITSLTRQSEFKSNEDVVIATFAIAIGYLCIGDHEKALKILNNLFKRLIDSVDDLLIDIVIDLKNLAKINQFTTSLTIIGRYIVNNIDELNYLGDSEACNVQSFIKNMSKFFNQYNDITNKLCLYANNTIIFLNLGLPTLQQAYIVTKVNSLSSLLKADRKDIESFLHEYKCCIFDTELFEYATKGQTIDSFKLKKLITKVKNIKIPEELEKTSSFCRGILLLRKFDIKNNEYLQYCIKICLECDLVLLYGFKKILCRCYSPVEISSKLESIMHDSILYAYATPPSNELALLEKKIDDKARQNAEQLLNSEPQSELKPQQTNNVSIIHKLMDDSHSDYETSYEDGDANIISNNEAVVSSNQATPNHHSLKSECSELMSQYVNSDKDKDDVINRLTEISKLHIAESKLPAYYFLAHISILETRRNMNFLINNLKDSFFENITTHFEKKVILPRDLFIEFKKKIGLVISYTLQVESQVSLTKRYVDELLDILKKHKSSSTINEPDLECLDNEVQEILKLSEKFDMIVDKMQNVMTRKIILNGHFYSTEQLIPIEKHAIVDWVDFKRFEQDKMLESAFRRKKVFTEISLSDVSSELKKLREPRIGL